MAPCIGKTTYDTTVEETDRDMWNREGVRPKRGRAWHLITKKVAEHAGERRRIERHHLQWGAT